MNIVFLVSVLTIPIFTILLGVVMWRYPPRINDAFGYRTRRSMSSPSMWRKAQPYAGRTLMLLGSAALPFTALVYAVMGSSVGAILISVSVQTLLIIAVIPVSERYLSRIGSRGDREDGVVKGKH